MGKKVAIFDVDGLLSKIENDIVFDIMTMELGLDPSYRAQFLDFFCSFEKYAPDIITEEFTYAFAYTKMSFLREIKKTPKEFLYYVDYFTALLGQMDGAKETLEELKKLNVTMYVLSNWLYNNQVLKLGILRLLHYFKKIYAADGINYKKPDIRAYSDILMHHSKENCTMIGDSYNTDIKGANDAGIKSILICKNKSKLLLPKDIKPTYIEENLYSVIKHI